MAAICFAMWLQEPDLASTNHLIMIFIGLVAVAMVTMAIAMVVVAAVAAKAIKGMNATVDELKGKVLPLIDVATDISKDAAPKVKHITGNLVTASDTLAETSKAARSAVAQFGDTISDVNTRTQRQVARVDGMVTAALTTTAEVAEAIGNGIRGPAQKIAAMVTQAKNVIEGLLAKVRAKTANTSSGSSQRPE